MKVCKKIFLNKNSISNMEILTGLKKSLTETEALDKREKHHNRPFINLEKFKQALTEHIKICLKNSFTLL